MRISILAVGRLKERWWSQAADEYLKRLGPFARTEVLEVPDRDVSRQEDAAVAREGDDLLRALPEGAYVVALDSSGKERTSEELAAWLEQRMLGGVSHIAFVVGGAAGLDRRVVERADESLSLSAMTFPHQMARVILLEQLYRAFKIIRGEPYHR
ncbi:MAG: 23S rRNA (pseudouridine(1915)-N(3))-methyltransferase RlmH [Coriobacteriia bacterium]